MGLLSAYVVADIHAPLSFQMQSLASDRFDLAITLGDIEAKTLDYIWFQARQVVNFGVLGNHDPKTVPGLSDLHGKVTEVKGVRFGGCGGSPKYKRHPNHYTERQVRRVLRRMPPVDVFISHAPPYTTSQDQDSVHQGFKAFDDYIEKHRPRYWLHGHLSMNMRTQVGGTQVIGIADKMPLKLSF